MDPPTTTPKQPGPGRVAGSGQDLALLLTRVARGDQAAFEAVYDQLAGPVYGLARKVLREQKVLPGPVTGDDVAELVETALDRQRVRRCLGTLTTVQAEAIKLAYYGGYTYAQTAELLGVALGTVKTRIRDGLIRLRDCLGVVG